jgi:hypothetical protein
MTAVHTSGLWVPMSVLLTSPTCTVRVDEEGEFHLQGPTVQQPEAVQANLLHTSLAGCVLNEPMISILLRHTLEELMIPATRKGNLVCFPLNLSHLQFAMNSMLQLTHTCQSNVTSTFGRY